MRNETQHLIELLDVISKNEIQHLIELLSATSFLTRIDNLVKSVALELGKDNITVNAVAPGAVNTPLYRSEGQRRSTSINTAQDQDRATLGYHSLPVPALEPSDIAEAIAFLAKDDARYISGAVLDVADGGNARYTA